MPIPQNSSLPNHLPHPAPLHPQWLPVIELHALPDASLWTVAIQWLDEQIGAGYLTIRDQPSVEIALHHLETLIQSLPWGPLDAPEFDQPVLVLASSLRDSRSVIRAAFRAAHRRHWGFRFTDS